MKTHLSIFLINTSGLTFDDITRIGEDLTINKITLNRNCFLYFQESKIKKPTWLKSFFLDNSKLLALQFSSSSTSALLITSVTYKSKIYTFAIAFGYGRYLLKDNITVPDFGLKTALNLMVGGKIRALNRNTLSSNPKIISEQITIPGTTADFSIDYDTDLIKSISGIASNIELAKLITGKDSLSFNTESNFSNIDVLLKKCLKHYSKKDYTKEFSWIDNIKYVTVSSLIDELDKKLLDKIQNKDQNVIIAAPQMLDWEEIDGFTYNNSVNAVKYEDLDIAQFYASFVDLSKTNIEDIKKKRINCWGSSSESQLAKWSPYECLFVDLQVKNERYILSNAKWYNINPSFYAKIEKFYKSIKQSSIKFPPHADSLEEDYNKTLSKLLKAELLDKKNISYGGGHSKIEVCDVFTDNKEIIHVKVHHGSASLSHLFSQGAVSGELLIAEADFRKKVRSKLSTSAKPLITLSGFVASKYTITFVVLKQKTQSIPFFSKITLFNAHKKLTTLGYSVCLNEVLP